MRITLSLILNSVRLWSSFITAKRRKEITASTARKRRQTTHQPKNGIHTNLVTKRMIGYIYIERERIRFFILFWCVLRVLVRFKREDFCPSQRGGVMLGLFACLCVNHTIYASLYFNSISLLRGCGSFSPSTSSSMHVCARATSNVCVMIWFLYQYRRKNSRRIHVMLSESATAPALVYIVPRLG